MKNWPYDTQVCTYTFGDLQQEWQPVNFWVHKMTDIVEFVDPGPGWSLFRIRQSRTDLHYCCKNVTNAAMHTIKLTFEIRREAAALTAIVIIPCVILAALTVSSQMLEVKGHVRAGLLSFNIYIHLALLKQVDTSMPRHGGEAKKSTRRLILGIRCADVKDAVEVLACRRSHPPDTDDREALECWQVARMRPTTYVPGTHVECEIQ
ncbi:hypothetical protein EVAR_83363_1 [Eumeta japonica]|uniref:Neuronal acetylcholine receptor subunit alpha-7 n=1 Tax=Eumeta variegata TaxID=151549 RepID=A0A4C1TYB6_EUMVA|nr:hypothetical protein EVAR_83363_1 [Eumeta japonica]